MLSAACPAIPLCAGQHVGPTISQISLPNQLYYFDSMCFFFILVFLCVFSPQKLCSFMERSVSLIFQRLLEILHTHMQLENLENSANGIHWYFICILTAAQELHYSAQRFSIAVSSEQCPHSPFPPSSQTNFSAFVAQ